MGLTSNYGDPIKIQNDFYQNKVLLPLLQDKYQLPEKEIAEILAAFVPAWKTRAERAFVHTIDIHYGDMPSQWLKTFRGAL